MKFLVTSPLPIHARTDKSRYLVFHNGESDLSVPLAGPEAADVWICDGKEVSSNLMSLWLDQALDAPKSMLVRDATSIPRLKELAKGRLAEIAGFPQRSPGTSDKEWEELILREAESLYARSRSDYTTKLLHPANTAKDAAEKETVILVGAGIMNLMTALLLAEYGFQVRIIDQGPDPRNCELADWQSLGVTSGGHNARMFTYTEADNYNEQNSELYQDMLPIFRKTVREGGWSVKPPKDFTATEETWVDAFERIPGWMAAVFKKDMYAVNKMAGDLWKELMLTHPTLFEDVGFNKDIVRLYVDQVAVEASVELNGRLGSLLQTPSREELLKMHPGLNDAADTGHLAGGIIVDGFTVNIHVFMTKILGHLASLGVEFDWNCQVQDIQRDNKGEVTGLTSQKGPLEADHFVLSPGTTGNTLIQDTACENLIHGVLGIWLQVPNLEPQIRNSIKIHRNGHKVEDINVTVAKDEQTGEDILIFGGAYGYVGQGRPAADSPELQALYDELEEVARIYFPRGYAEAKRRGPQAMYPGGHRKYCVRPFTPTGLGVFERIPTAGGGQLFITGGNNTGGFAQAPAVAKAVLRALQGEPDPIHILFHPDRGRLPAPARLAPSSTMSSSSSGHEASQKFKLLLLCSDGPQHKYLRYRLEQICPGYRCIQEPDAGQIRHLRSKSRTADAWWQQYHGLRRRILGYATQRRTYFERLVPQDYTASPPDLVVDTVNCSTVWDAVEEWKPDVTIVSGTKYIGKKVIARSGLMINLHTGHLPDYKGNHCIFFALYDGRPDLVASTLHQLTSTLDGGNILDKVFPTILPGDTEDSLYTRCLEMSIERCVSHVERFAKGESPSFTPQMAEGRVFRHRDRTPMKELRLWWRLNVGGMLREMGKKIH